MIFRARGNAWPIVACNSGRTMPETSERNNVAMQWEYILPSLPPRYPSVRWISASRLTMRSTTGP